MINNNNSNQSIVEKLIQKYPTFVENGIPNNQRIRYVKSDNTLNSEIVLPGEENEDYMFKFMESIEEPRKYFLHIAIKNVQNQAIYKTLIYSFPDIDSLKKVRQELCEQKKVGEILIFIENKINEKLIISIEKKSMPSREEQIRYSKNIIKLEEKRQIEVARNKFNDKEDLAEAIKKEVIPTLVRIQTRNGIVGTGFFQHSEWLVSNAHIISFKEILDGYTKVIDYKLNELTLDAESSYHRPSNNENSPDVVIIKTNSRSENNNKCFHDQLERDQEEYFEEKYKFYIDFNLDEPNGYEIKFLRPLSKDGTYPIIYECEDNAMPQPGNSGTPIIEARVIKGHVAQWQFRVIGVLYARCSSAWYNNNNNIKTSSVTEDKKLVCAIPVEQEFSQILNIIYEMENSVRQEQMAIASESLKDKQGEENSKKYREMSKKGREEKDLKLKKFENGESPLNIALPDGLEKLWYKGIVEIEKSLMIRKILKKELGKKAEKFPKVPDVTLEDLQRDFTNFLKDISKMEYIKLQRQKNFLNSPKNFFRLDVEGSENSVWLVEIQDNTGKDRNGKPYHLDGDPLSSTFAKVSLSLSKISSLVKGSDLANLFIKSHSSKEPLNIIYKESEEKENTDKQQKYKKKKYKEDKKYEDIDFYTENFSNTFENDKSHNKDEEFEEKLDIIEILIPADGNCLYTSIFIGYLLPVICDTEQFKSRLLKLINKDNMPSDMDYHKFSIWMSTHFQNINALKNNKFKKLIELFKKNMGFNNWGGEEEISVLSNKLNITIQECIEDPDNNQNENAYVFSEPTSKFTDIRLGTIKILKTNPKTEESLQESDDVDLQIAKINSVESSNQLQHYRLILNDMQINFVKENLKNSKKFTSIYEIPQEIWLNTFSYLNIQDLAKIGGLNRFFRVIHYDKNLWKQKIINEFELDLKIIADLSTYSHVTFKDVYIALKKLKLVQGYIDSSNLDSGTIFLIISKVDPTKLNLIDYNDYNIESEKFSSIEESIVALTVMGGNLNFLKKLVQNGYQPLVTIDSITLNTLHIAALCGNLEIVKYYIEELKMDPLQIIEYFSDSEHSGKSLLHCAAISPSFTLVEYVIECNDSLVKAKDSHGRTSVFLAAQRGKFSVVKFLLERYPNNLLERDKYELSLLHMACESGNINLVKYLIDIKKHPVYIKDRLDYSTLHSAAQSGNLSLIKYLIETIKLDPMMKDFEGRSIAFIAALGGHFQIVQYIIENCKLDIEQCDNKGRSLLYAAVCSYNEKLVKYLIFKGANPHCKLRSITFGFFYERNGTNILQASIVSKTKNHSLNLIKFLIEEMQLDPNEEDSDGGNALYYAAHQDQLEIVKYLIEDIKIQLKPDGKNVLYHAVRSGKSQVLKYLLENTSLDPKLITDYNVYKQEIDKIYPKKKIKISMDLVQNIEKPTEQKFFFK